MTEDVRLNRIEDKVDKVMERLGQVEAMHERQLALQEEIRDIRSEQLTVVREGALLDKRVGKLEDRQGWLIKILTGLGLIVISILTGVNFLL